LVEGANCIEHCIDSFVVLSNGHIAEDMDFNETPNISEEVALSNALIDIDAEEYAWENDSLNYFLIFDSCGSAISYYPEGDLIWTLLGDTGRKVVGSNYTLAWKFDIWPLDSGMTRMYIYVDAYNGEIIRKIGVGFNDGPFNHLYYGNQTLDTRCVNRQHKVDRS
jgi:hypothetical protein